MSRISPFLITVHFILLFSIIQASADQQQTQLTVRQLCQQCSLTHSRRITCSDAQEREKENLASEEWIRMHTKACPSCKAPIEKDGGGNHMTCICKHQFCWLCLGGYQQNQHECDNNDVLH